MEGQEGEEEVYTLQYLVQRALVKGDSVFSVVHRVVVLYYDFSQQGKYVSLHPLNINFVGNLKRKELMRIHVNPSEKPHIFCAPEVLKGKKCTQISMVWNLGLIIDFILQGKPFFSTLQ